MRKSIIDRVLDATIKTLEDHLIDYVLVGEDRQPGAWGYRVHGERLKDDVKKRLNKTK